MQSAAEQVSVSPTPLIVHAEVLPPPTIKEKIVAEAQRTGNDPVRAVAIAKCESELTQFNPDGTVLRGKENPKDTGIFQVNEYYHLADAKRLGYDIHTIDGNIAYAMLIMHRDGVRHWNYSRACWDKPVPGWG